MGAKGSAPFVAPFSNAFSAKDISKRVGGTGKHGGTMWKTERCMVRLPRCESSPENPRLVAIQDNASRHHFCFALTGKWGCCVLYLYDTVVLPETCKDGVQYYTSKVFSGVVVVFIVDV